MCNTTGRSCYRPAAHAWATASTPGRGSPKPADDHTTSPCPPIRALQTQAGRAALASVELSRGTSVCRHRAASARRFRAGAARPPTRGDSRLTMRCPRAPTHTSPDARGRLPWRPWRPRLGGRPGTFERPHLVGCPYIGHPIGDHVAGPSSVDLEKAGRRHALRGYLLHVHRWPQMT